MLHRDGRMTMADDTLATVSPALARRFLPFDLPRNDYRIVLADPPWQYDLWKGKSKDAAARTRRRVVEDVYDTLPLETIKALPVKGACDKDAVLLLWVTMPLLREGLAVIEAWGFAFETALWAWGKLNADGSPAVGIGRYTRSNVELCLLATRGDGVEPVPDAAVSDLLLSRRGKHSEKPMRQYDLIDAVFGREVPRVELFARQRMARWDAWGFEAPEPVTVLDLMAAGLAEGQVRVPAGAISTGVQQDEGSCRIDPSVVEASC
jgi:N6-adenosine-specific RNA methylase IME4